MSAVLFSCGVQSPLCHNYSAVVHVNTNAKQQVISSCVILNCLFFYNSADLKNETKKETVKINENVKKNT